MVFVDDQDMRLKMNDAQTQTPGQVKDFTEGSQEVELKGLNTSEKYLWIEEALQRPLCCFSDFVHARKSVIGLSLSLRIRPLGTRYEGRAGRDTGWQTGGRGSGDRGEHGDRVSVDDAGAHGTLVISVILRLSCAHPG